jgi:hypothetical protein
MRTSKKEVSRRPGPAKSYSFMLWLHGANPLTTRNLNALYEAGCSDATFGSSDGEYYAEFDRRAVSYASAVVSAIDDIRTALPRLRVTRVESERASAEAMESAINGLLSLDRLAKSRASTEEKRAVARLARRETALLATAK